MERTICFPRYAEVQSRKLTGNPYCLHKPLMMIFCASTITVTSHFSMVSPGLFPPCHSVGQELPSLLFGHVSMYTTCRITESPSLTKLPCWLMLVPPIYSCNTFPLKHTKLFVGWTSKPSPSLLGASKQSYHHLLPTRFFPDCSSLQSSFCIQLPPFFKDAMSNALASTRRNPQNKVPDPFGYFFQNVFLIHWSPIYIYSYF